MMLSSINEEDFAIFPGEISKKEVILHENNPLLTAYIDQLTVVIGQR